MRFSQWLLFGTLLLGSLSQAQADSEQPIEQFSLANGMKVIVLPNHRVPAVNHMLWFRIGAADDPDGKSGLAHFHEHVMFKGSPKFGQGEYTRLVDLNGGNHNAFTGHDATSYYVTIAKEKLPLVMELEADRMKALTVFDEEALKENEVIREERRQMTDNSPDAQLQEQMNAALFRNHPYHNPVIGWMHEMKGLTKQDVLDFHSKFYHPNNAILIVSGDITAAELKPLAEKYYGGLPKKSVPPRIWKQEPPQISARSVTLHHPHVKQPSFSRDYIATSIAQSDMKHALSVYVMAYLLGGGKNSELYQSLVVEQKLAASVDTNYNLFSRGDGELSIDITPENNVTLATIEQALDKSLAEFLKKDTDGEKLARAKKAMKAETIYGREGLTSISNIMGWIVTADLPPETYNQWNDLIDSITADDIKGAAKNSLKIEQSVTGYLLPQEALP